MTEAQQRQAAKKFIQDWTGRGDEKQDTARFLDGLTAECIRGRRPGTVCGI